MFRRRRNREVPQLNTTSTADISFMLLIFFLVTSSMDTDKGLTSQLPPPEDTTEQQEQEVKQRNVLELRLDADDVLTCNGEVISNNELTKRVEDFVANAGDVADLPEKSEREVHLIGKCRVSDRHIITIEADRQTTYNAYFEMQNAIVRAYRQLREKMARQQYGHSFNQCSDAERDAIKARYPQRISEGVK